MGIQLYQFHDETLQYLKTSTAKQVLGNCERMVLANFILLYFCTMLLNFLLICLIFLVVNLYIVLVDLCTDVLYMLSLS